MSAPHSVLDVYFLLWWDPDHEVERAAPSRRLRTAC